jgi:hypothetical protein
MLLFKNKGETMFQKITIVTVIFGVFGFTLLARQLPDLKMPVSHLGFREIQGYEHYRIVATHFRKDKHELRYILANKIAYNAFLKGIRPFPNGSKIVKIGWSVEEMAAFPSALEANKIQRIEYMIREKNRFKESDGWGYARFVKKNGKYEAYKGNVAECAGCHAAVKDNDAVFTRFQPLF